MSDTAIFITISSDDLNDSGQLPGDIRSLKGKIRDGGRVVHIEVVADAPLPEKTLNALHMSGAVVTLLPSSGDNVASLVGGLMTRLHEFITCYPHLEQILLADAEVDRLAAPASFLQKAGFTVLIAGTDRSRMDALRSCCDHTVSWTSGRSSGRDSSSRDSGGRDGNSRDGNSRDGNSRDGNSRDDSGKSRKSASSLDPYEVLVEEVTKGRDKGNRVLLTSLKQRIRKRIRRFDETRLKDTDGKPMKQFKDFVLDAVNRGLIQLVEKGNASHVLLPNEAIPDDGDEEENGDNKDRSDKSDKTSGDPLLDNVEMAGDSGEENEKQDIEAPGEKDFDIESVNEEASAPPESFMTFLDNMLPSEGLALGELLHKLQQAREEGHLELTNRQLKTHLQNAFYNELLEAANEGEPVQYVVVDDWKDIINFL